MYMQTVKKFKGGTDMALEWRNKWKRKEILKGIYLPGKKLVVFDVETTGLGEKSKIIQFSSITYTIQDDHSLLEQSVYDTYINPHEKLTDKIVEITGITDDILEGAPDEEDVVYTIFDIINSADIVSGYNVPFDMSQVERLGHRTGRYLYMRYMVDVCEMARDFIEKNDIEHHKLENVVRFLFPSGDFAFHDSLEDVRATAGVLELLERKYRELQYEGGKMPAHLDRAYIFINPKKESMQRICLKLSVGNDGDIFYDVVGHYWSCKSTSSAKKLFGQIDMCDVERQMYKKYVIPFNYNGIDDMAKGWMKFMREKKKERLKET